jgi:hypothetical protein
LGRYPKDKRPGSRAGHRGDVYPERWSSRRQNLLRLKQRPARQSFKPAAVRLSPPLTDDLPLQAIICGRYRDTFQRINGRWWFDTRVMLVDLVGDLGHHLLYELTLQASWACVPACV